MSIINANNIIPEFKKETFDLVVENYPLGSLYYQNYFATEFRADLTFASAEVNFGAKVMADIVSIGSKAPRKSRDFAKTYTGEIPKIEIARDLTENDQIKIQQLRNAVSQYPNNESVAQQLLQKIYEDPQFCIDGVNSRLEWTAKQLASKGSFETTVENNAGGVAKLKIDFKVTSSANGKNIFTPTGTDLVDYDPMVKIREKQTMAIAKGQPYVYMVTDRETFNQFVKYQKVQLFSANFNDALTKNYRTPSVEQVNAELSSQGLPTFVIWESYFYAENKKSERVMMSGWEKGAILFTQSLDLGSTQYTLTPEFSTNFADVMTQNVNNGFILVKTFGHQDPIMVSTKATAFAMPVLNNLSRIEILKMAS